MADNQSPNKAKNQKLMEISNNHISAMEKLD